MKLPIRISAAAPKHRIQDLANLHKMKKMAIAQNRPQLYDTRPLKPGAYNKLKNHLGPHAWKALVAIVEGETLQKGVKLTHLEPIIRFLLTESGWRQGQTSQRDEDKEAIDMTLSVSQLMNTQNNPTENHSSAPNATKDSQEKADENGNNSLSDTIFGDIFQSQSSEMIKDSQTDEKCEKRKTTDDNP